MDHRSNPIDGRPMNQLVIRLLRVARVVLLLGSVLGQVPVPPFASQAAKTFPEVG